MPKVGKKQFAYTSAGKKAAKAYAKKVGKKVGKYQVGGSVDPFSSKNPEGIIAKEAMDLINEMNMEGQDMQDAIPTTNAMDRSQASPVGDEVGTGVYKEGGKVKQGSLAERISTGIQNRQNFKDRKKAWGVEEARKSYEEDTMKQRMKRTEAKRQAKVKKAEAKKLKERKGEKK